MRVRRVGAGLCEQGGINKEPFINPLLLETVPAGAGLSVETLAGNYFFQGSVTCACPWSRASRLSDPGIPSLSQERGG